MQTYIFALLTIMGFNRDITFQVRRSKGAARSRAGKKLFELFHESCWKTRFSRYFSACKRKDDSPEHPQQPKKPRLVFTDLQRRTLQAIFKVRFRLDVVSPNIQIGSQISCKVVVHDVHLSITSIFESSRHWNCCGFSYSYILTVVVIIISRAAHFIIYPDTHFQGFPKHNFHVSFRAHIQFYQSRHYFWYINAILAQHFGVLFVFQFYKEKKAK